MGGGRAGRGEGGGGRETPSRLPGRLARVLSSCFSNFWKFITNYARSMELYARIHIHARARNVMSKKFPFKFLRDFLLRKFKVDLFKKKKKNKRVFL